jgi:3-deoxy-D-manno-octulosonic-acid transferase
MKLLYQLFITLYPLSARLLSPFNQKAALWIKGRREVMARLEATFGQETAPVIWVHCASLGEFEQGLPVMEALKKQQPNSRLLVTFFSPSGYEVRKHHPVADLVCYLPMDSAANAARFLRIVKPALVLFIKYEFWFHYLEAIRRNNIPLLLVSAVFRDQQVFFKSYGGFYRHMLACFTHLFVQDAHSLSLLQGLNLNNVSVAGDTRYDRVLEIAGSNSSVPEIEFLCAGKQVVIAGSTWLEDDKELCHYVNNRPGVCFIIAPHTIGEGRIRECREYYRHAVLYSELSAANHDPAVNCIIIDNMGLLSRLYRYATVAFIGGGFGADGIHNTLEAAVYGKPLVFGPEYVKYIEAVGLVEAGAAFPVNSALELEKMLDTLLQDAAVYGKAAETAAGFVQQHAGATDLIMNYTQQLRLQKS